MNSQGTEILDVSGSGYGGNAGFLRNFDITRESLDLTVGYKQRTTNAQLSSGNVENYYMTYLGFRAALYF